MKHRFVTLLALAPMMVLASCSAGSLTYAQFHEEATKVPQHSYTGFEFAIDQRDGNNVSAFEFRGSGALEGGNWNVTEVKHYVAAESKWVVVADTDDDYATAIAASMSIMVTINTTAADVPDQDYRTYSITDLGFSIKDTEVNEGNNRTTVIEVGFNNYGLLNEYFQHDHEGLTAEGTVISKTRFTVAYTK